MYIKRAALFAVAAISGLAAAAQTLEPVRVSPFSGEPVPRFVSLRHASVHGRVGPSLESPIAFEYARQGLPVLIVKESGDWRRIRDPAGDEAWIHKSQLSAAAMAIVTGDAELLGAADIASPPVAMIEAGAVLRLGACEQEVCSVRAGNHRGWVARTKLWGAPLPEGGL